MFVPVHHRARTEAGRRSTPVPRQQVVAGLIAGLATAVAAGVTSLFMNGGTDDAAGVTVIGILIALGAAAGGFVLARVIGRRGKI